MNIEKLKCIFSVICALGGLFITCIFCLFYGFSTSTSIGIILLGISLLIIGLISFCLHYRSYHIIGKLKAHQKTILAHWTFSPLQIDTLRARLKQDQVADTSIAILITFLAVLVGIGFLFNDSSYAVSACLVIAGISIVFCLIALFVIKKHYTDKLTRPIEAIISEDYIYFFDELYGLQHSFYLLSDVVITSGQQPFLQFTYGLSGLDLEPAYIVSIPIPNEEISEAVLIQQHFLQLI